MSSRRTERLLNLVICLLATRRWLTKEQIRAAVPQYLDCESPDAFDRMFERDKEDLRELGVPLITGSDSSWFDDEIGYRIDAQAYSLPEVEFTAEESAVLGLASRLWQHATLAGPAARALVKLRALGVETDMDSLVGVEPRVRTAEPAFAPLYAATRDRAPVGFRYRKPSGELSDRHVEPWAITGRGVHWYLVGHDRDRGATRAFRLSRVEGAVRRVGPPGGYAIPEGLDAAALVSMPRSADDRLAVLRLRSGRGGTLRHRGRLLADDGVFPDHPVRTDRGGGGTWDVIQVRIGDVEDLAQEICGYGADVVALAPPDLRTAVLRLLGQVLTTHGVSPPSLTPAGVPPVAFETAPPEVLP